MNKNLPYAHASSKRSVMYMAKFIYRVFLVLAIAAAVWGGVHYVMGVRSGEQLQNGVELVKDTDADGRSHWNGKDTELFQRMVYFV